MFSVRVCDPEEAIGWRMSFEVGDFLSGQWALDLPLSKSLLSSLGCFSMIKVQKHLKNKECIYAPLILIRFSIFHYLYLISPHWKDETHCAPDICVDTFCSQMTIPSTAAYLQLGGTFSGKWDQSLCTSGPQHCKQHIEPGGAENISITVNQRSYITSYSSSSHQRIQFVSISFHLYYYPIISSEVQHN